jgi:hypothetical protein
VSNTKPFHHDLGVVALPLSFHSSENVWLHTP